MLNIYQNLMNHQIASTSVLQQHVNVLTLSQASNDTWDDPQNAGRFQNIISAFRLSKTALFLFLLQR